MPCLSPIVIKRPAEKAVTVPCGRCAGCLAMRRNEWTFRIMEEEKQAKSATFLTLTYDNSNIPTVDTIPVLQKSDLQKYFKKVRKEMDSTLVYYAVGEYGSRFGRPHYHAIVFNASKELLKAKWTKGISQCDKVSQASIHYVTKYIINRKSYGYLKKKHQPFAVMSKGLGKRYAETHKQYHQDKMDDVVIFRGGVKQKMPRYLREKIFTDEQMKIISERNSKEAEIRLREQDYDLYLSRNEAIRTKVKQSGKSTDL